MNEASVTLRWVPKQFICEHVDMLLLVDVKVLSVQRVI